MHKLSPSDFKYLWEDCKHCYFRKIKEGITLPSVGFPSIFSKMSGLLQGNVQGKNPKDLHADLPSGLFVKEEGFLESKPLPSGKSYIKGRFDLLTKFDDGTFGVLDVKMTDPNDTSLGKFERQLHAYKYALENPAKGDPVTVSKLGLLIVAPTDIRPHKGYIYYKAQPVWKEIPLNMDKFFNFISEVEALLDGQEPSPNMNCNWCKYKHNIETSEIAEF